MESVRTSFARGRDGVRPASLERELVTLLPFLSSRMREGTLRFTNYRQLLISKGAHKAPRIISVPTARDRIVLKCLAELLSEVFPEARGVIPQSRVREVAQELNRGEWDYFISADFEDFYPSIKHDKILDALKIRIRKEGLLNLIVSAIETPTVPDGSTKSWRRVTEGVPQGLSISNILAEIVALQVDRAFVSKSNCAYFRFVDDVVILCREADAFELVGLLENSAKTAKLKLHARESSKFKEGYIATGFEFLGYRFDGNHTSVRKSSVSKLESSLARAITPLRVEVIEKKTGDDTQVARALWRLNLLITGCIYRGSHHGWLGYYRQMDDLTLIKRLDVTLLKLRSRFKVDEALRSKSFMKTYWVLRRGEGWNGGYVPNFDELSSGRRRELLIDLEGVHWGDESDLAVDKYFDRMINRQVSYLEKDVGHNS